MYSSGRQRQRGLSIIEAVVFIVVIGIGVAGIATLFNQLTRHSSDPLVRKQALLIATSLMEEIQLRGFTYCDPDDAAVHTATGTGDCTPATVEAIGPNEPSANAETRYASPRFDNVNDYHGFSMSGANVRDITGTQITGLEAYSASVSIVNIASTAELQSSVTSTSVPTAAALRITVTVTGPFDVSVSLQGYRTRYAPNQP